MKVYKVKITDKYGISGECKFHTTNKKEAMKAARLYIRQWQLNPATIDYCLEEFDKTA